MSNSYYDHTTYPSAGASGSSAALRAELDRIEQGFEKLPALTGAANRQVFVKADESGLETREVSGASTAADTSFTPAGNLSSTNVQAALQELDTEKVAKTDTIATNRGGTGATTFTSGGLLRGNGTGALTVASATDIVAAIGSTPVQNANSATTAGRAKPQRSDAVAWDLFWADTGGQETYVLGSSNGSHIRPCTTSGLSVNYAANAGALGGVGAASYALSANAATDHNHNATYLPLEGVDASNTKGALVIAYASDATHPAVGTSYSASSTYINATWYVGFSVSGTWRCVGKLAWVNDTLGGGLFRKTA